MTLLQQQQQMTYGNYPAHPVVNTANVSPNIHGFYPPGQIVSHNRVLHSIRCILAQRIPSLNDISAEPGQ